MTDRPDRPDLQREEGSTPIAPPPSLHEVLNAGRTRLGRVDLGLGRAEESAAPPPHPREPDAGTPARRLRSVGSQASTPPSGPSAASDHEEPPSRPRGPETEGAAPVPRAPSAPDPFPAQPSAAGHAPTTPRARVRGASAPVGGLGAPEEELRQLSRSVAEVAASVIARMREAGEANRRHLEALEAEAARRCELLTAQAELDAELIRLHARREAHAIVAAARLRAGEPGVAPAAAAGPDAEEATALAEVTETFAHFAELFGDPLGLDDPADDPAVDPAGPLHPDEGP